MVATIATTLGCADNTGQIIEADGWTLFRYAQMNMMGCQNYGGRINIISADCPSLLDDDVLYIPARIGRHNIHGFGRHGGGFYGASQAEFWITFNQSISRIVIAANLHIGRLFWEGLPSIQYTNELQFIEFRCNSFDKTTNIYIATNLTFIIPNNSTRQFLYKFGDYLYGITIIEKGDFLENK